MAADKNTRKEMLIRDREMAFSQACRTVVLCMLGIQMLSGISSISENNSSNWLAQPFEKQSLP